MHLVAVGRLREGPEAALFDRYQARLNPKLSVLEIAETAGGNEARRRENLALRAALPARGFVVALDQAGATPDSRHFAAMLARWRDQALAVYFVIGGADGLDAETLARADTKLSLGNLTWPHLLARVMLIEQIYRAQAINMGHPYHRARRP